jgi:hypothetical protein
MAGGGLAPSAHSRSVPGYGREPVGNGHAAAGFSAVLAPAADGTLAAAVIAVRACGLAGFAAALFFFLAAFFFLPATLLDAFFLDDFFFLPDFFFFFFLPPFFAFFFFAITISLEVVAKESPALPARTIQAPGAGRRMR